MLHNPTLPHEATPQPETQTHPSGPAQAALVGCDVVVEDHEEKQGHAQDIGENGQLNTGRFKISFHVNRPDNLTCTSLIIFRPKQFL